jgi:hypothetical protein
MLPFYLTSTLAYKCVNTASTSVQRRLSHASDWSSLSGKEKMFSPFTAYPSIIYDHVVWFHRVIQPYEYFPTIEYLPILGDETW